MRQDERALWCRSTSYSTPEHLLTLDVDTATSPALKGCLSELQLPPWGYKVFVPKSEFVAPSPVITKFIPGHDFRQLTNAASGDTVHIEIHFSVPFSVPMDCQDVRNSLRINSTTADSQVARLDESSIDCGNVPDGKFPPSLYSGGVKTTWVFAADLIDVSNGIHTVTVSNASTQGRTSFTKVLYLHSCIEAGSRDDENFGVSSDAFTTRGLPVLPIAS